VWFLEPRERIESGHCLFRFHRCESSVIYSQWIRWRWRRNDTGFVECTTFYYVCPLSGNTTSKWDRIIQTKRHFLQRDFSPFLRDSGLRLVRRTRTSEHSLGVTWLPAVTSGSDTPGFSRNVGHGGGCPGTLEESTGVNERRAAIRLRASTPHLGNKFDKEGAPLGPVRVRGQSRRFP
jgi:hypothetical protein